MYAGATIVLKYLRYLLTASNGKGHGIHSPFVFRFVQEVLETKAGDDWFTKIEAERNGLLMDKSVIPILDFGAGSRFGNKTEKKVGDIARHALKSPKYARLINRLARFTGAATALELGTSLGTTTAYLAAAPGMLKVNTLEGSPAVAARAQALFISLHLQDKITIHEGDFAETLPLVLQKEGKFDLIFMDGNHRYEPTLTYWNQLLPFTHRDSVIIVDDIHWSREMENAWEWIQQQPQVSLTIDLFFVGLVFFKTDFTQKQHFTIRH